MNYGEVAVERTTEEGWHYIDTGRGSPTLVFVHGYACSHFDWRFQIERLSSKFRCLSVDLPGHGRSPCGASPILPSLAAAVNSIRRHANAGPAILIGHSLGTKVVREAFRQSPENIAGLAFVDGSLNIGDAKIQSAKAAALIATQGLRAMLRQSFTDMFVAGSSPDMIADVVARTALIDEDYASRLYVEAASWDSEHGLEQLRQISVPTLLLQSSYYNIDLKREPMKKGMTTPLMEASAREIRDVEIRVIERVGHFAMLEAPQEVSAAVENFADRLGRV